MKESRFSRGERRRAGRQGPDAAVTGTRFSLEVRPSIPAHLQGLEILANDLLYSWDRQVRRLFFRLDEELWNACSHNPKLFLRRISQQRLEEAADNHTFMEDYNHAIAAYKTYHQNTVKSPSKEYLDPKKDLVAYFCAEFGFHESLPIYSGGLGILAGDHCKAASDLGIPFVGLGMLYRQGYFTQTIDENGLQVVHYIPNNFSDLPLEPARESSGDEIRINVELPGREVALKVWKTRAGRMTLYLLDADLVENRDEDRAITHQLYGGDIHTRMQQEIILGIGGVRALRRLDLQPTVWHINEGHAAFQILERCREQVRQGMDFDSALEWVAAGTVFTTHTPVPAGHDIFAHEMIRSYFDNYIHELGVDMERFLALGASPSNPGGFNQTALALHGSRFHNGVSRIHGSVASKMESYVWPEIPAPENPIRYVTNGIHVHTFLAREWVHLFNLRYGGDWRDELLNEAYWQRLDDIPDHSFWSLRQSLKAEMLGIVRRRLIRQLRRNGYSDAHIDRITRRVDPENTDILTVGLARRFATYKRATLLFSDPKRLERLLNDPDRPVVFIFAGKAHPNDQPGQDLICAINDYACQPQFEGKIILLEGYDLGLSRDLVSGVDLWLNTPAYPLEASGTSGQKAGINGALNLSVLDGWWAEGYNGENGWAINPHAPGTDPDYRDREEAQELLSILENKVIPLYYQRDGHGFSEGWVAKSKASMKSLLPRFNSQRMVMDYVRDFYGPASRQRHRLAEKNGSVASELAGWKKKVAAAWPEVRLRRLDSVVHEIQSGEVLSIRVAARLAVLTPADVTIECLVGIDDKHGELTVEKRAPLAPKEQNEHGETVFELDLEPPLPGLLYYKLRMYPSHLLLSHEFETGLMRWL